MSTRILCSFLVSSSGRPLFDRFDPGFIGKGCTSFTCSHTQIHTRMSMWVQIIMGSKVDPNVVHGSKCGFNDGS